MRPWNERRRRSCWPLRWLAAAPVPGASWRLRAFLPASGLIRVRLEDDVFRAVLIELPRRPGVAPTSLGFWWYVGALRGAARWVADNTEAGALDLDTFTAAGVLPDVVEITADDGLDYVVADLVGDPYRHAPAATVAPDLYHIVGFDTRHHGVVRLYCALPERGFIGIDVGTTDPESERSDPWVGGPPPSSSRSSTRRRPKALMPSAFLRQKTPTAMLCTTRLPGPDTRLRRG